MYSRSRLFCRCCILIISSRNFIFRLLKHSWAFWSIVTVLLQYYYCTVYYYHSSLFWCIIIVLLPPTEQHANGSYRVQGALRPVVLAPFTVKCRFRDARKIFHHLNIRHVVFSLLWQCLGVVVGACRGGQALVLPE